MATLVTDCPRCGVKRMTFDVNSTPVYIGKVNAWALRFEICCVCRECHQPTIFRVCQDDTQAPNPDQVFSSEGVVTRWYKVESFVSVRDIASHEPPAHVPEDVRRAFEEAATCIAVQCWNAAGAMFRACIDLATKGKLPPEGTDPGPSNHERRNLSARLKWLFANQLLPRDLEELSECVREDGNDSVHSVTLQRGDAEDLLDFTLALLERIYTEPAEIEDAKKRRAARRQPKPKVHKVSGT